MSETATKGVAIPSIVSDEISASEGALLAGISPSHWHKLWKTGKAPELMPMPSENGEPLWPLRWNLAKVQAWCDRERNVPTLEEVEATGELISVENCGSRRKDLKVWLKNGDLKNTDFIKKRVLVTRPGKDGSRGAPPMIRWVKFIRKDALVRARSPEKSKTRRSASQKARKDRPQKKLTEQLGGEKVVLQLASDARHQLGVSKCTWYRWRDKACFWLSKKDNRTVNSAPTGAGGRQVAVVPTDPDKTPKKLITVWRDRNGVAVPKPDGIAEASRGDGAFEYCFFKDFEAIKINREKWEFSAGDPGIYTLEETANEIHARTGKDLAWLLERLKHQEHTKKIELERVRVRSKHRCRRRRRKGGKQWKQAKDQWMRLQVKTGFTEDSVNAYIARVGGVTPLIESAPPAAPPENMPPSETPVVRHIDWDKLLKSGPMSVAEIASAIGEPEEVVDQCLRYFRQQHEYGWIEDQDPSDREPRIWYKMPDVLPHLQRWHLKREKKRQKNGSK